MCWSFQEEPLADYQEVKVVIPTFVKFLFKETNLSELADIIATFLYLLNRYEKLPKIYLDAHFIGHLCTFA